MEIRVRLSDSDYILKTRRQQSEFRKLELFFVDFKIEIDITLLSFERSGKNIGLFEYLSSTRT